MEHCFLPRSIWNNESKFVQHAPDLYTSVVVTRHILAGTSFGPCVLQNTFYDTIAFIALKSSDKRNKSYIFRVDPEAMRSSVLVFSWLRLVQAARDREEQNTEAYLKGGQLYIRTTRDVRPEEELLVWYDQELSHLLGFTDMRGYTNNEFKCVKCDQVFKNEHPFLAHCRFLCTQLRNDTLGCEAYQNKTFEIKRQHRVTDFHNLARDLEHKTSSTDDDADMSPRKRKYDDAGFMRARTTVLLEKTNISNDNNITQLNCDQHLTLGTSVSILKQKAESKNQFKREHLEYKNNALSQPGEVNTTFTHNTERKKELIKERRMGEGSGLHSNNSSAFSFVLSNIQDEQKSAFCRPSKRTSESTVHLSERLIASSNRQVDMSDAFASGAIVGYRNLLASNMLNGELTAAQTMPAPVPTSNGFPCGPEHWSRSVGAPQTTSSLTLLPPTFTSFGVSVQNWCAKCNLSFRMTSDLVFHMRSHHKKEFAVESQVRRRREEKLTCPICHEYFRERHHLSRHMTSHN